MKSTFQAVKSRFLSHGNSEENRQEKAKAKIVHPHLNPCEETKENFTFRATDSPKRQEASVVTRLRNRALAWSKKSRRQEAYRKYDEDDCDETKIAVVEEEEKKDARNSFDKIGGILRRSMHGLRFSGLTDPDTPGETEAPSRPRSLQMESGNHLNVFSGFRKSKIARSKHSVDNLTGVTIESSVLPLTWGEENQLTHDSATMYSSGEITPQTLPEEPGGDNGTSSMSIGGEGNAEASTSKQSEFEMDDLPTDFTRLDNKAAYDKIALRPKARKAARKARGRPQHVLHSDSRFNGFDEFPVKDQVEQEEEEDLESKEDSSPKAKRSRPPSESTAVPEEAEAPKTPNKRFSYLGGPGMVVPSLLDVQNIRLKKTSPLEEEKKPLKQDDIPRVPLQSPTNPPVEVKAEKKSKTDLFSGRFFHKSKGQKISKSEKDAEKKKAKEEKSKAPATSPISPATKKKEEKATKTSEKPLPIAQQERESLILSGAATLSPTSPVSPVSEKEYGRKKTTDKPIFKKRFGRDKSKDSAKEAEPEQAIKSPVNSPTSPSRSLMTKQTETQKEILTIPGIGGDQSDDVTGSKFNKGKSVSSPLESPVTPNSPEVVKTDKPTARPRLAKEKPRDNKFAAALMMFLDAEPESKQEGKVGGTESRRNYSENNSKSVDSDVHPLASVHAEAEDDETRETERKKRAKSESEKETILKNWTGPVEDEREKGLSVVEGKEDIKGEKQEKERDSAEEEKVSTEEIKEAPIKETVQQVEETFQISAATTLDDEHKEKDKEQNIVEENEEKNIETEKKTSTIEKEGSKISESSAQPQKKSRKNFSIKSYRETISPSEIEKLPDVSKSSALFTTEEKLNKTRAKNEDEGKILGNKGFNKKQEVQSMRIVEESNAQQENKPHDSKVDENQDLDSRPETTPGMYSKPPLKPIERAQTNRVIRSTERRHQSMNLGPSSPKPKRTQSLQNKAPNLSPKETFIMEKSGTEIRLTERSKVAKDDENNNISLTTPMVIQEKSQEKETVSEETNYPKPKLRTTSKNPPVGARKLSVKKETTGEASNAPSWISLARRRSKVWEDAGVRDIKTSTGILKQTKSNDGANRPNSLSLAQKPTTVTLKSRENAPQSDPTSTKPIVIARKAGPDSPLKHISPLTQSSNLSNRKPPLNSNDTVPPPKRTSVLAQKDSPSGPAWLAIAMQKQKRWTKEETA